MSNLSALLACAGNWRGSNKVMDPTEQINDSSDAQAQIESVFNGKFVAINYTWAYRGQRADGLMLVGFNPHTGVATINWVDSWHMQPDMMHSTGTIDAAGAVTVQGAYAAPPGPDWGWRTILTPGADSFRIDMVNITPDGQEAPAVEMIFERA